MHNLDMFLFSVLKLMVLPGLLLGAVWVMRGGQPGFVNVPASLGLGAVGGLAGSLALAGIVATLKLEAWRGSASVYVAGSLVGAFIMLALAQKMRG
jgi:hypothetical protein